MDIKKAAEQAIIETPHKVDVRRLYDKESAQVMYMTLLPGETLKPHITPVDVFFFILEGTPDVRVGNETITVEANSLVDSPKGIVHCLSNNSQSIARVLVVKAPRPTQQTKVL